MSPSVIHAVSCPCAVAVGFRALSPTALPYLCPLHPKSVRSGVRRAWTLESGRHGCRATSSTRSVTGVPGHVAALVRASVSSSVQCMPAVGQVGSSCTAEPPGETGASSLGFWVRRSRPGKDDKMASVARRAQLSVCTAVPATLPRQRCCAVSAGPRSALTRVTVVAGAPQTPRHTWLPSRHSELELTGCGYGLHAAL